MGAGRVSVVLAVASLLSVALCGVLPIYDVSRTPHIGFERLKNGSTIPQEYHHMYWVNMTVVAGSKSSPLVPHGHKYARAAYAGATLYLQPHDGSNYVPCGYHPFVSQSRAYETSFTMNGLYFGCTQQQTDPAGETAEIATPCQVTITCTIEEGYCNPNSTFTYEPASATGARLQFADVSAQNDPCVYPHQALGCAQYSIEADYANVATSPFSTSSSLPLPPLLYIDDIILDETFSC